jgi:hypothetical protein
MSNNNPPPPPPRKRLTNAEAREAREERAREERRRERNAAREAQETREERIIKRKQAKELIKAAIEKEKNAIKLLEFYEKLHKTSRDPLEEARLRAVIYQAKREKYAAEQMIPTKTKKSAANPANPVNSVNSAEAAVVRANNNRNSNNNYNALMEQAHIDYMTRLNAEINAEINANTYNSDNQFGENNAYQKWLKKYPLKHQEYFKKIMQIAKARNARRNAAEAAAEAKRLAAQSKGLESLQLELARNAPGRRVRKNTKPKHKHTF